LCANRLDPQLSATTAVLTAKTREVSPSLLLVVATSLVSLLKCLQRRCDAKAGKANGKELARDRELAQQKREIAREKEERKRVQSRKRSQKRYNQKRAEQAHLEAAASTNMSSNENDPVTPKPVDTPAYLRRIRMMSPSAPTPSTGRRPQQLTEEQMQQLCNSQNRIASFATQMFGGMCRSESELRKNGMEIFQEFLQREDRVQDHVATSDPQ